MSERDWLEEMQRRGLTRRSFVKGGLGAAGALSIGPLLAACGGGDDGGGGAAQQAGTEEAEKFTGTLTVTGLGVDLIDPIKEAAEAALGFTLAFDVTDTVTARNKAVTQPQSLDIFSGYFNDIDQVWPSGNLAPIPIEQVERWDELTGLYKTGTIQENEGNPACQLGDGDAPFRKLYTTEDREIITWADPTTGEVSGDEPGPWSAATSTWTRWATTATSSSGSPPRSTGTSSLTPNGGAESRFSTTPRSACRTWATPPWLPG
jgi:hypothetical protein